MISKGTFVASVATGLIGLLLLFAQNSVAAPGAPLTPVPGQNPIPSPPLEGPGGLSLTASGGVSSGANAGTADVSVLGVSSTPAVNLPAMPVSVSGAALSAIPNPPITLAPAAHALPGSGLTAPLYLTAIAGNRSVVLSWYPSEGSKPVSGYLVFRGPDAQHISPAPINLSPVADTSYNDNDDFSVHGPLDRQTYSYRVRAFAPDGLLSPYS